MVGIDAPILTLRIPQNAPTTTVKNATGDEPKVIYVAPVATKAGKIRGRPTNEVQMAAATMNDNPNSGLVTKSSVLGKRPHPEINSPNTHSEIFSMTPPCPAEGNCSSEDRCGG